MSYVELRRDLLKKLDITRQALHERVKRRKRDLPMSTADATCVIAHEHGMHLDRYVPEDDLARVRGFVGLDRRPIEKPSARARRQSSGPSRKMLASKQIGAAAEYLLSDRELRERCKDLLTRPKHLDRVVREATTVLENRIRMTSKVTGLNPEDLVNRVLNADLNRAVLQISQESTVQQGFHSVCRGIVLAFRHPVHHALDDKVTPEHALKVCGFIDVLLDLLGKATRRPGA